MPELAEIEVIRLALEPLVVGRSLRVEEIGPHDMRARGEGRGTGRTKAWIDAAGLLDGARVSRLERRGKRLAMVAADGRVLVVQLGMSGQLMLAPDAAATHRHVTWRVSRQRHPLVFRDPRRFGGVTPYASPEALQEAWDAELGVDALSVTGPQLAAVLRGTRFVKALLLDQRAIAGVGNIYADESLFLAGIDPRTRCAKVGRSRARELADAIRTVLRRAVRTGGSTLRDHRTALGKPGQAQQLHAVYGRSGEPCVRCGALLRSATLAGRTTTWCPGCQRRSRAVQEG